MIVNPLTGYFKYSIMEMIFHLKLDVHFLYEEAMELTLAEFKWFFERLTLHREQQDKKK